MTSELESSYRECARAARRAASSFWYTFYLLPFPRRRAMQALYAYLRRTDDLVDNPRPVEERRADLANWRAAVKEAWQGTYHEAILPALVDSARRYDIPRQYLFDVIDGVEMDLEPTGFETFADLEEYSYRVASVVGLACLHIWGFEGGERAFGPARQCGVAFQLTNILRDLGSDARRGCVYLPREDLARFHCTAADLRRESCSEPVRQLVRFEIERIESLHRAAAALPPYLSRCGRRMYGAMVATYQQLLDEIKRRDGDVLSRPVRVPRVRRLSIALKHAVTPIGRRAAGASRPAPARAVEMPPR